MIEFMGLIEVNSFVLEDEILSLVILFIREICLVCEVIIVVESLNYGICFNGYRWYCCSVLFIVCIELVGRCC